MLHMIFCQVHIITVVLLTAGWYIYVNLTYYRPELCTLLRIIKVCLRDVIMVTRSVKLLTRNAR